MNRPVTKLPIIFLSCLLAVLPTNQVLADETCMSPYMAKIVGKTTGQKRGRQYRNLR